MKKIIKLSLALCAIAIVATGCNCYSKMMKSALPNVKVSCSPEILTLKGDNAIGTLSVTFPAKAFHAYGILKVTPVLKYNGGEVVGQPQFLQGEKVKDNYTVIPYVAGGSYTQELSFPYKPEMRLAELVLRVEAKCVKQGPKIKNFTDYKVEIPVAFGVSSLQLMADDYAKVAIAPDALVRTTQIKESAKIMFEINKAKVRPAQLNSQEIADLQKFIADNTGDAKKKVGGVYTQAYASPDGPLEFNDKLSKERGTKTKEAVETKFKKDNTPAETFDINAMGEDWEGFKELVSASDIADKALILQVLSMYSDPQVRDREIKNMSAAFTVLKEKILPELRRSKMTVNVQVDGLTDAELKAAVGSDMSKLTVEEMLFSATLFSDNATKAKIYKTAADKYNDFRAWNNLGVVNANEGDYASAKTNFEKASRLNNSNPQVLNNLGVVALADGKKAEAAKLFAASTAPEAKYNKGLVELANGNYSAAAASLDGYNKALAELLNGNTSAAKSAFASINTWRADYVKAVIAAKEGNSSALASNLKAAIAKNPKAKQLAETEVNFLKYAEVAEVVEIVKIKIK